jgi:transcriptional regulator with XRE-family HTH domain
LSFSGFVRSRLTALDYEQKDLARAARVTDSYVSQLLTRKKRPPEPDRTDIYRRMAALLQVAPGELERLARIERVEEIKRELARPPEPLYQGFRELLLRKCFPERRAEVRSVFETEPFGVVERIVARSLLNEVQSVARRELDREDWLRLAAAVGGRTLEEMRVLVLEFLDAEVYDVSNESCAAFLDPLVEQWDIDLDRLRLLITLHHELVTEPVRAYSFVEEAHPRDGGRRTTAGLAAFLDDATLASGVTERETALLRAQVFSGTRPNKLYYYRALQNLRDPIHFDPGGGDQRGE